MNKKNNKNQLSKKQIEEQARQKQAANDRKVLLLLGAVAAIILLIVGASVLYDKLSDGYDGNDQLVTLAPGKPAETDTAETEGSSGDSNEGGNEYSKAPDFTVYDEARNEVKLSDYIGKPIVLNFWASWCGPCKTEMPDFNEKYLELGDSVTFIMLNATAGNDSIENARAYVKEQGFSFPVMYDLTGDAMSKYGINSFPTTFFIDSNGNIIAYANGTLTSETLQRGIDMITN